VLVSEPVLWDVEYRCVLADRTLLTLSPYWRDGTLAQAADGSWPAPAAERLAAQQYITELLADPMVALPPGLAIDIGSIAGRGWDVVEANSIWGAGIYGGDPSSDISYNNGRFANRPSHCIRIIVFYGRSPIMQ
jgi:hypothetical protein